jgi:hypothetical protein
LRGGGDHEIGASGGLKKKADSQAAARNRNRAQFFGYKHLSCGRVRHDGGDVNVLTAAVDSGQLFRRSCNAACNRDPATWARIRRISCPKAIFL